MLDLIRLLSVCGEGEAGTRAFHHFLDLKILDIKKQNIAVVKQCVCVITPCGQQGAIGAESHISVMLMIMSSDEVATSLSSKLHKQ